MTTVTASLAQSTTTPRGDHNGVTLAGTYTGAVSVSGSGLLLMAKIPVTAKDVQLSVKHTSGATTQVVNYGIKPEVAGSNTISVSAFGQVADATYFVSSPLDMNTRWNQAAGAETYKYVTASVESGTVTATSYVYTITYSF